MLMGHLFWVRREQDPPSVRARRIGSGQDEGDPPESEEGGRQGARCWGLLGQRPPGDQLGGWDG